MKVMSRRHPSSACRHLLPQGEKGDSLKAWLNSAAFVVETNVAGFVLLPLREKVPAGG